MDNELTRFREIGLAISFLSFLQNQIEFSLWFFLYHIPIYLKLFFNILREFVNSIDIKQPS